MKGLKTTIIAIASAVLGISVFVMWYLGKIETLELAVGLSAVGWFSNALVGYFSKDATASHTFDVNASGGNPNPNHEQH